MRRLFVRIIAGTGLLLAVGISIPARAATIDVACNTADLVTAITTANGNGEPDTINLAIGCTYSFTAGDVTNPDSALPQITSEITVNGNGATITRVGGSPAFRLIYMLGGNVTLNDLTISGGESSSGGGIVNNGGALTVFNTNLISNFATSEAGGILNGGPLTIINSMLSSNNSSGSGGGLYNIGGGAVMVFNSIISSNSAPSGGGIYNVGLATLEGTLISGNTAIGAPSSDMGGGIYNTGSLTLNNSTVSGNTATIFGAGGGIYNAASTKVVNSTISGNSGTYGGGIYNANSSTLVVIDSTVSSNIANNTGGGIIHIGGSLTVLNSAITGNTATNQGGGFYFNGGSAITLANNTISGNSATSQGGGIFIQFSAVIATNNTIAGNSAGTGGGIYSAFGTATVTNGILWGNSTQVGVGSGTVTVTHSIVQGGYSGTGNLNADPLFVTPVPFSSAPTIAGDYHVQADSPALNVGSNAALPADTYDLDIDSNTAEPIPFDGDGNPRVVNATVDMGAYEHQTAAAVVLSETSVDVAEGGATDTYTVHLASRPAGDVTVTPGGDDDCDGSVALTFTTGNWSTAQTVTVTAVDDAIAEGNHGCSITNITTSGDPGYTGIGAANVNGSVTDNDSAGVTVSQSDGTTAVTEGGATDTYTVVLTSEPTADVTITPAGDTNCSVSVALTFTNANWDTPQTVTVTAIDDAVAEGDHGCTVTNTSASGDPVYDGITVASVDATIADNDPFTFELLTNSGMETDADLNKVPDGWTLVNKTGDKLLCDPAKAHSGNCAFKFKGGVPENAKLSQVADLTGMTFATGDTLTLSAWFKGVSTAAKTKFILSVTYTGNPIPVKTKLTVKQHTGYTLRSVADYVLTAGTVDQIKVTFQHKSAAGTVYVDDASLIHTLNGPRSRSGAPLPPPAAPQGFRGGN